MGLKAWLANTMTFVPPELEEDEWEQADGAQRIKRMQALRDEQERDMIRADEIPGVSAVHWAPMRPIASRVAPRYPGFYAVRSFDTVRWRVAEVILGPDNKLWWSYADELPAQLVSDGTYEWSNHPLVLPR